MSSPFSINRFYREWKNNNPQSFRAMWGCCCKVRLVARRGTSITNYALHVVDAMRGSTPPGGKQPNQSINQSILQSINQFSKCPE
jgi:hypothetical protein